MDLVPDEVLADILHRLRPRPLAVCRSVSKHLRAVIDGRGLLLAHEHRIPRRLRGIFVNYVGQDEPYFFSRPEREEPRIDAVLSFLPPLQCREILHSSNGLLLVKDRAKLFVCNPATRRWTELPQRPVGFGGAAAYLIFDPTVSLHYEVISFSEVPLKPKIPIQPDIERPSWYEGFSEYAEEEIENLPSTLRDKYDREAEIKGLAEWPPSSYGAQVFSSRTGQWEERIYVRENNVAVTLSDVWSDPWALTRRAPRCGAVYWRGAFYLHCRGGFIMRLSLLEQKYRVIKTPSLDSIFTPPKLDINDFLRKEGPIWDKEDCLRSFEWQRKLRDRVKPSMHLAKSEHGIYYTALRWHQLQVWVLHEASESHPMLEWELKHKADIKPSFLRYYTREDRENIETSWSLDRGEEGTNDELDSGCDSSDDSVLEGAGEDELNYGWDSSDDSVIDGKGDQDGVYNVGRYYNMSYCMNFLGCHPSKEIVFLGDHFEGFAYYLDSSMLQYLGTFDPVGCCHYMVAATHESFIYTPCLDDLLPDHKRNTTHDGDLEEVEVDTDEEEELEESPGGHRCRHR